jgi:polyisoprenyl-phosphate glycosyltransferase
MASRMLCAIVMPVYEDLEAATELFEKLKAHVGKQVYVVAVDDGSVRQPLPAAAIAAAGLSGVVLRLKRNVGHQRAIAVGVAYVAEHLAETRCVIMDSDGEDLPVTIPPLLSMLDDEAIDVAVAQRRNRMETAWFQVFYAVYKCLFQILTGRQISFGNFMALTPAAVRRLSVMHELGTHIAGTVLTSKLRLALCPIDRGPRYAGRTKMSFTSLVLHGCRALMIFAEDVLVRINLLCFAVAAVSVAGIVLTIVLKAIGLATPGWFSVALGILLLVLLQTGALTLMTLMLTGVVRAANPIAPDYRPLIDTVQETDVRQYH